MSSIESRSHCVDKNYPAWSKRKEKVIIKILRIVLAIFAGLLAVAAIGILVYHQRFVGFATFPSPQYLVPFVLASLASTFFAISFLCLTFRSCQKAHYAEEKKEELAHIKEPKILPFVSPHADEEQVEDRTATLQVTPLYVPKHLNYTNLSGEEEEVHPTYSPAPVIGKYEKKSPPPHPAFVFRLPLSHLVLFPETVQEKVKDKNVKLCFCLQTEEMKSATLNLFYHHAVFSGEEGANRAEIPMGIFFWNEDAKGIGGARKVGKNSIEFGDLEPQVVAFHTNKKGKLRYSPDNARFCIDPSQSVGAFISVGRVGKKEAVVTFSLFVLNKDKEDGNIIARKRDGSMNVYDWLLALKEDGLSLLLLSRLQRVFGVDLALEEDDQDGDVSRVDSEDS